MDQAAQVGALFPAIYRRLASRSLPLRERVSAQALAVLDHLAQTGPLTISEAARHLRHAQSSVSEQVERLEARGLLARIRDERDRRRTLVWLTPAGRELLARAGRVLSPEGLARALARMRPVERRGLIEGMRALVRAADEMRKEDER